jgi:mRNA interferase YafQ
VYQIHITKKYRKSFKRQMRSGNFHMDDINFVINILAKGQPLHPKYKNHQLTSEMRDYLECHIKNDLLLIYQIRKEEGKLILFDIGSHSDLFG